MTKQFQLTTLQQAQLANIELRMRNLTLERDLFIRAAISDHYQIDGTVELLPDGVLRIEQPDLLDS